MATIDPKLTFVVASASRSTLDWRGDIPQSPTLMIEPLISFLNQYITRSES